MKIVIDTNILFSALLSKETSLRKTLFSRDNYFYSPNFVVAEIFKHKERILKYSKSEESDVYEFLNSILKKINFVNEDFISIENWQEAFRLCSDIDQKDTPFVALALELNAMLWTGDNKLKRGLIAKGFNSFFVPDF
ncbi:MAG: putative toxin-antitoxin system toxin component, PIN family [candidate division KSB1 bacterium]|nr:putative toxin-antitoxin system toxin component, PIN family [candidate division KSB1 bacterium]MDZ7358976.1 putative toxin-antitoxin system toxin component, PIN family [candidate division KSB1 bacterium]MDZ7401604.1 putative toxin-antitoxin system toxin component, PIN family [candidate division KSB1 bacterium]